MKRMILLLPWLLLAPSLHASPQAASPRPDPTAGRLSFARCVRVDSINEWHILDARTLLVRTGPYRYLVSLKANCPRLGIGVPGLLFHASESDKASSEGRLCGGVGETVSARDQPPCAISTIEEIDKTRFETLRKAAVRNGTGADLRGDTGHDHR